MIYSYAMLCAKSTWKTVKPGRSHQTTNATEVFITYTKCRLLFWFYFCANNKIWFDVIYIWGSGFYFLDGGHLWPLWAGQFGNYQHYWPFVLRIHQSLVDSLYKGPVVLNFSVFFDVRLNSLLNKQLIWESMSLLWFENPWVSCDLRIHESPVIWESMSLLWFENPRVSCDLRIHESPVIWESMSLLSFENPWVSCHLRIHESPVIWESKSLLSFENPWVSHDLRIHESPVIW